MWHFLFVQVVIIGEPSCSKCEGQTREETCLPACKIACARAIARHLAEVTKETGYVLDSKDTSKVVESCGNQCTNECKPQSLDLITSYFSLSAWFHLSNLNTYKQSWIANLKYSVHQKPQGIFPVAELLGISYMLTRLLSLQKSGGLVFFCDGLFF